MSTEDDATIQTYSLATGALEPSLEPIVRVTVLQTVHCNDLLLLSVGAKNHLNNRFGHEWVRHVVFLTTDRGYEVLYIMSPDCNKFDMAAIYGALREVALWAAQP